MGIGVSSVQMARSVANMGQLGVVSGTAIDSVFARRLQDGDEDGDIRWALTKFPDQECVAEILARYFVEGGREESASYLDVPKLSLTPTPFATKMLIASSFVEVTLAKRGTEGLIGINFLEKIQLATPASVFGAILADVDYILMGAGIPADIPQLIRDLLEGKKIEFKIKVEGADKTHTSLHTRIAPLPPPTHPSTIRLKHPTRRPDLHPKLNPPYPPNINQHHLISPHLRLAVSPNTQALTISSNPTPPTPTTAASLAHDQDQPAIKGSCAAACNVPTRRTHTAAYPYHQWRPSAPAHKSAIRQPDPWSPRLASSSSPPSTSQDLHHILIDKTRQLRMLQQLWACRRSSDDIGCGGCVHPSCGGSVHRGGSPLLPSSGGGSSCCSCCEGKGCSRGC